VKHALRVDISAEQCPETHNSPFDGFVPKEINSGYGVARVKELNRLMQRPKTVKSKQFLSNDEGGMGKTDNRPG
jgi:hypothetical protein